MGKSVSSHPPTPKDSLLAVGERGCVPQPHTLLTLRSDPDILLPDLHNREYTCSRCCLPWLGGHQQPSTCGLPSSANLESPVSWGSRDVCWPLRLPLPPSTNQAMQSDSSLSTRASRQGPA